VLSASVTELVPLANHSHEEGVAPEGFRMRPGQDSISILTNTVSEDYFSTVGIPIVQGRAFRVTDTGDTAAVAVVNEQFASRYFPGRPAIGSRFRLGGANGRWVEVVGVAKLSKYMIPTEPPTSFIYLPLAQNYRTGMTLLLQSAVPPETLAAPLRDVVRSLDSNQPIFAVRTMEQYFRDRATKTLNVLTGLMAGMGLLGLILALSGLYAVMAWSVTRRSREIGIRMAVGAAPGGILGMVLKQGLRLSLTGVAIGLGLVLLLGRSLTAGIGLPFSTAIVILVPLALLPMTALGAYVPARRAAKLDPIRVLKEE